MRSIRAISANIVFAMNEMKDNNVIWRIDPYNKNDDRFYDIDESVYGVFISLRDVSKRMLRGCSMKDRRSIIIRTIKYRSYSYYTPSLKRINEDANSIRRRKRLCHQPRYTASNY